MPELPEVERARKYLLPFVGKTIIRAKAPEDTIVFSKQDSQNVVKNILGKKILDVKRHGKVFWLELEDSYQLGFHFGMTGELKIKGQQLIQYRNAKNKNDVSWPPRWYKMMIYITDDKNLIKNIDKLNKKKGKKEEEEEEWEEENNEKINCFTFCDVRRLGRVWLSKDIMKEEPLSNHGFDIMNEVPPFETYLKSMKTKTCGIKSLLLDQSFSSGIGNWIADEILYQAKVHPLQNVSDLDDDDIKRLYDAMNKIIKLAISVNADADQFPKDWIFHYRWSKRGSKENSISIPGVGKVEFLKAGGRTSAIVPTLQKLKKGNNKRAGKANNKAEENETEDIKETIKGKSKKSTNKEIEKEEIDKEEPRKTTRSSRCKKVKMEEEMEEDSTVKKATRSSRCKKVKMEEEREEDSTVKKTTRSSRCKKVKMEEEMEEDSTVKRATRSSRCKKVKMEEEMEEEPKKATRSSRCKKVKMEEEMEEDNTVKKTTRPSRCKKEKLEEEPKITTRSSRTKRVKEEDDDKSAKKIKMEKETESKSVKNEAKSSKLNKVKKERERIPSNHSYGLRSRK